MLYQLLNINDTISSFVFYNVVTFGTSIRPLHVESPWPELFLILNSLTLVSGLVCVTYATLITLFCNDLLIVGARRAFLKRIQTVVTLCSNAFAISLLCFLAGFARYGIVAATAFHSFPALELSSSS